LKLVLNSKTNYGLVLRDSHCFVLHIPSQAHVSEEEKKTREEGAARTSKFARQNRRSMKKRHGHVDNMWGLGISLQKYLQHVQDAVSKMLKLPVCVQQRQQHWGEWEYELDELCRTT
jgi:hypothetical protein